VNPGVVAFRAGGLLLVYLGEKKARWGGGLDVQRL
jgi:hypothetical protein